MSNFPSLLLQCVRSKCGIEASFLSCSYVASYFVLQHNLLDGHNLLALHYLCIHVPHMSETLSGKSRGLTASLNPRGLSSGTEPCTSSHFQQSTQQLGPGAFSIRTLMGAASQLLKADEPW